MPTMTVSAVRREFGEAIDRVAFKGEHVVLKRHGKNVAAIVPMEALKLMEEIENQILLHEIHARKKAGKGKGISLAQLLKKYEE